VHTTVERDIGPEDPNFLNGIGKHGATPRQ
jgi:hypothetical protein